MKTLNYNVSGMASGSSKTKIKNALNKIEGIQQVAVDLSRGTVEIQFNAPADASKIQQCIQNTGYSIES